MSVTWGSMEPTEEEILDLLDRMEAEMHTHPRRVWDYFISALLAVVVVASLWAVVSLFSN